MFSTHPELGIGPPERSVNHSLHLFVGFFNAGQGFCQRRGRSRANVIPCYVLGTILIARRNNYKMIRNKSLTYCWILAYSHQLVKSELYTNNAGRTFILLIIWVNAILTAFRELSLSSDADRSLQDLALSVPHSPIVLKTSKVTIIYGKLADGLYNALVDNLNAGQDLNFYQIYCAILWAMVSTLTIVDFRF